ncbi:GNAT family N-acetyltransferase [uncultured Nitrosomonas sp.]|uniref:GNAT family N-acetyltransferase n=1 Tax=uncultured Nitrosomonas sp. TaxID=156424 RepID=UPI0026170E0C|nr:GNAT family N-acetyltransferase [uncultured Nitrosomonas sp.]
MNNLQERLSLLKYKGGFKAALFWLAKILCRVEIHFFYAIDLTRQQSLPPSSSSKESETTSFDLISLNTPGDLTICPSGIIEQINSQSGRGVSRLIREDAGVYALVQQGQVVSQTNIDRSDVIRVDSPTLLDIDLKPGDVFLGYLYTHPNYRGMGAAALLLKKVHEVTRNHGHSRIVTHIRSTNVASLNTFKKCGWSRIGWIITSVRGRLLLTCHLSRAGVTISMVKQTNQ